MDGVETVEPQSLVLSRSIDQLVKEMEAVTVENQEQYDFLSGWLRRNKDSQKSVDEFFEPERVQAKKKYDDVLAQKNAFKKPLEASEMVCRKKMTEFATIQEKKRREEQKLLEEENRKKAEEDRLLKMEELSAMGRTEQAIELVDKRLKVEVAETETKKVGKTIEVWTVTMVDLQKFLSEASGFPLVAECIEVSGSKLSTLFKKQGIKEFAGLKIEQTFRPVL